MSTAPQWRTTSIPPVPPEKFGKDHWSTFAYVETRIVDHRGTINHDHMRCDADRHPILRASKRAALFGMSAATKYPTRLVAGHQRRDHDDYDCLDDLIAAGLLEVHMPAVAEDGESFRDADGKPIMFDGQRIHPDFVTGLLERQLAAWATFSLTEQGYRVAGELRRHKAGGGSFATFRYRA